MHLQSRITTKNENSKNLDAAFRRLFDQTEVSQEQIKNLRKLYSKGKQSQKGAKPQEIVDPEYQNQLDQLNSLDPYYNMQKDIIDAKFPPITVEQELDYNTDGLSGVSEYYF